ncbi:VOC family protein [Brevibacterium atlanticum]|uniref:VOC family protein n=1 Tax=Brevibacterium atlanticum TaxID=2697563 RepID=UPI0014234F3D|nr:VOC family protein [Brevibacterium atlanticum]
MPGIHHVEVWLADLENDLQEWGWLLGRLGFTLMAEWENGQSWSAGGAYLSLTTSPNSTAVPHDRRRPGVNHLAFKACDPANVDSVMNEAPEHGWFPLYHDRYPHAGGEEHYAGWIENSSGFKAEIVAESG